MEERNLRSDALALLGLARRAGAVAKGTGAARQALRKGEARLLIVATDGSETQREKVVPAAQAQGVPWIRWGSMDDLGGALGTGPVAAVAVTRDGFAGEIRKRLGRE